MTTAIEELVKTPDEELIRTAREVLLDYLRSSFPTDERQQQADLALSTIFTIFRLTRP